MVNFIYSLIQKVIMDWKSFLKPSIWKIIIFLVTLIMGVYYFLFSFCITPLLGYSSCINISIYKEIAQFILLFPLLIFSRPLHQIGGNLVILIEILFYISLFIYLYLFACFLNNQIKKIRFNVKSLIIILIIAGSLVLVTNIFPKKVLANYPIDSCSHLWDCHGFKIEIDHKHYLCWGKPYHEVSCGMGEPSAATATENNPLELSRINVFSKSNEEEELRISIWNPNQIDYENLDIKIRCLENMKNKYINFNVTPEYAEKEVTYLKIEFNVPNYEAGVYLCTISAFNNEDEIQKDLTIKIKE